MELLWEHHFLFISTMFYWTRDKLPEIFIFSISILWEYTLLELCHCILQVKIENNQVLHYCHGVTMGKPNLFITTTFTGPVLVRLGICFWHISVVGDTLFMLFDCRVVPPLGATQEEVQRR